MSNELKRKSGKKTYRWEGVKSYWFTEYEIKAAEAAAKEALESMGKENDDE